MTALIEALEEWPTDRLQLWSHACCHWRDTAEDDKAMASLAVANLTNVATVLHGSRAGRRWLGFKVIDLADAVREVPTERLRAFAYACLDWRNSSIGDPQMAAVANANLLAATEELESRHRAETEMFDEYLALLASPVRIVGVELPGRNECL